jgi:hypothetical protein
MHLPVSYWSRADPSALMAALQDGARDSIVWRLSNMDRADRAVLEAAAVIGMSFTSADVATALADTGSALPECLDRLAEWGLIRHARDPRGAADASYRFWHPLHAELCARGAGAFDVLRASSNLSRDTNGCREFA